MFGLDLDFAFNGDNHQHGSHPPVKIANFRARVGHQECQAPPRFCSETEQPRRSETAQQSGEQPPQIGSNAIVTDRSLFWDIRL
jgi:hypothetical protein